MQPTKAHKKTFLEQMIKEKVVAEQTEDLQKVIKTLEQKSNDYAERSQQQGVLNEDPHASYLKGVSDAFDMAAGYLEKHLEQ